MEYLYFQIKDEVYRARRPEALSPSEIRALRKRLFDRQSDFMAFMGISRTTFQKWECGINNPSGAAARLIGMLHDKEVYPGGDNLRSTKQYEPDEIKEIRENAGMSRTMFALILCVSRESIVFWESGRTKPNGPARRLLEMIEARPELCQDYIERVE